MTITAFTKTNVRQLEAEVQAAMEAIAKKHGLTVTPRGGRFSGGSATLKTEFAVVAEDGTVKTPEYEALQLHARLWGVDAAKFDEFRDFNGEEFKVVGYRTRAPKKPFIIENQAGKQYITTAAAVARAYPEAIGLKQVS